MQFLKLNRNSEPFPRLNMGEDHFSKIYHCLRVKLWGVKCTSKILTRILNIWEIKRASKVLTGIVKASICLRFPVRTVRHSFFAWDKGPRWSARSNSTESWLSTGEVFYSPTHYQHVLKRRSTGLRRDWWSVWDLSACWREMEREENKLKGLETQRACVKRGTAVCPGLCDMLY